MAHIPIERKRSASLWPALLALLGLVVLGVLLMKGCTQTGAPVAAVPDTTAAPATPTVTGGTWDADFGLSQTATGLVARGKVATEAAKAALLQQLAGIYPGVTVVDSLVVDASATSAPLLGNGPTLFGYLSQVRNAALGLNGQAVTVRGDVRSQAALDDVTADLRGALPTGYTLFPEITVVAPSREVATADSLIAAALVAPIPFRSGSEQLGDNASTILDRVAAALVQFPNVKVAVEGHTDNTGSAETNQRLSQQRAETVMRYLAGKGIAAERMTAVGYGQTRPVADNATEEGRAQNRRVVFSTE